MTMQQSTPELATYAKTIEDSSGLMLNEDDFNEVIAFFTNLTGVDDENLDKLKLDAFSQIKNIRLQKLTTSLLELLSKDQKSYSEQEVSSLGLVDKYLDYAREALFSLDENSNADLYLNMFTSTDLSDFNFSEEEKALILEIGKLVTEVKAIKLIDNVDLKTLLVETSNVRHPERFRILFTKLLEESRWGSPTENSQVCELVGRSVQSKWSKMQHLPHASLTAIESEVVNNLVTPIIKRIDQEIVSPLLNDRNYDEAELLDIVKQIDEYFNNMYLALVKIWNLDSSLASVLKRSLDINLNFPKKITSNAKYLEKIKSQI